MIGIVDLAYQDTQELSRLQKIFATLQKKTECFKNRSIPSACEEAGDSSNVHTDEVAEVKL